ncbi:methyltransferase domain-containing protein [Pseudomonas otitidis]|uniref:class I SAM-dependent methyltransferase n=1 Tax=Metapseudomonas otitidis TaxID=319939 RepID=UPI00244939D8|nr:class I SAM-dependent methyltransferase [Pseudomonas otitidis]MDH1109249.1 methyltransferase domain-containing protein [Pseudomonas otitidis]MDH1159983.1 methyltransferase domain-containing protein [Pseudomonas otitidis]MDH1167409.1 methyltransferase domain-containing protein [Pseudomonas otitidis]
MPIERTAGDLAGDLAQLVVALVTPQGDGDKAPDTDIGTPFSTMSQADWCEAVYLWNRDGRPLIAGLEQRACPACGATGGHRRIFESYDGYPYEECGRCGCWHVPLVVDALLFERFFGRCPKAAEVARRSFNKRMSEENRSADLARFDDYFTRLSPLFAKRQGRRYLDMGCGLGNSLVAAGVHGFEAFGVESSRECLRLCQEAGLDVRHVEQPLPPGGFDLISFWESLEHMADPSAMLGLCHRLLAENGVIAFTVPNIDSPLLRAQRGDCSVVHGGYDTPGHINLFGASHLSQLLERCGFALLHIDGQYGMSLPELAAYMLGRHRGAADLLAGHSESEPLPLVTRMLLNAIGPAVSLLERLSLTAPILFVVACRQSDATGLAEQARAMDRRRNEELLAQATPMARSSATAQVATERREVLRVQDEASRATELLHQEIVRLQDEALRLAEEYNEGAARAQDAANHVAEKLLQETARVAREERKVTELHQEVSERNALLAAREAEVEQLSSRLGAVSRECAALSAELQQLKSTWLYKLSRLLAGWWRKTRVQDNDINNNDR